MPRKYITPQIEEYIKANRLKLSSRKMADALGCSKTLVQNYIRNNGITPPADVIRAFKYRTNGNKLVFTPEMDAVLKDNYLEIPVKPLAASMGISAGVVNRRLEALGLVIPKEVIQARKKRNRFKKGQVSHNKGKRQKDFLSPEALKRVRAQYFKKGHEPHNQKEGNGVISIRVDTKTQIPYKYIRIRPGKWELYQREVWKREKGKIPRGHLISFRDGNSLNCNIENLDCISKAENAVRNMEKYKNYPDSLQQAIKLKNKLIKNLNKNEKARSTKQSQ